MIARNRRYVTAAELHVLLYVALGKSHKEVAASIGIKASTVRYHLNNSFEALQVHCAILALKKAGIWGMSETDILTCIARLASGASWNEVYSIIESNKEKNKA